MPRNTIGAVVLSLTALACSNSTAPAPGSNPATETYAASLGVTIAAMTKVNDALYTQDVIVGTGAAAANGDSLSVTYTGWLVSGIQFDSNVGKAAFPFKLGIGYVIGGWDEGLVGLKVGGKRRLVIGSDLGYGAMGGGCDPLSCVIPPNSTLVFDVQLISKKP